MITSFSNSLVKRIKRLRQKKYRRQEGAFFAEGLRVVLTAVEAKAPIDTLVYCADLLVSPVAQQVLREQQAAGVPCVELAPDVFASISEREHPTGLGAIIKSWQPTIAEWPVQAQDVFVVLMEVSDPGNLGTILRTMDAAGAAGLILVGATVDPFHPTTVKASMGTLFTVPISHVPDLSTVWQWAASHHLQTIATSAQAASDFRRAAYHLPCLLFLGSERQGLSAEILQTADLQVTIPMMGTASSLNVAVAAGLMLYALLPDKP